MRTLQTELGHSLTGAEWHAPPPLPAPQDAEELPKPPLTPPMAELARWSPPRIARLITDQRDYAAMVLTVDAVADFWPLQGFARCKVRAFAGVTQLALLTHPELSARCAYPGLIAFRRPSIIRSILRKRCAVRGAAFVVETSGAPAAFPAAISGQSSAD